MISAAGAGVGDAELLTGVAAGDPTALNRLLDEVAPVIWGFVFARVAGDAAATEDLVQETLLEALRSRHTYRGDAALSTWMCTIARRRLARHYDRERKAEVARSKLRLVVPAEDDAVDELLVADQRQHVMAALSRLPVLHRQVLVLRYLDDRPVGEVAAVIGKSTVQAQSLLQRARDGLRRELESSDG